MKTKTFKLNPIRTAMRTIVVGATLMSVNQTVMAAQVSTELNFTCPFPLIGDQNIIAQISANYPEVLQIKLGDSSVELPSVFIDAITIVPDKARQGLAFVDATTITGFAHSINTFHTVAGSITNNTDLKIVDTTIPTNKSGPFDVPATGNAPAQLFDDSHIGTVTLTVDDLIMDLKNLKADGSVAPAPVGEFTADCTLNPGQDNVLTTFEITAEGAVPDIDVNPVSIDFGKKLLGQASEGQDVVVRNTGGGILGVSSINISGNDATDFVQTNNCTTLAGGESCTVTITYTASEVGLQDARLEINSTDPDPEEATVLVTLRGVGAIDEKPEIDVELTPIDFGDITENEISKRTVLISNIGTAPLTIFDVSTSGDSEFTSTSNCSTIAVDSSCTETVTYTAVEGVSTGAVVISSDDESEPNSSINLIGNGVGIIVDPCEADPTLPECEDDNDLIIPVVLDVKGSTYMAANGGTLPLTGNIESEFNLTRGSFTGSLNLDPTQGKFEIIKGWSNYLATAQIEFEPVGVTKGTLIDGKLTAISTAYVKIPKVTKTLFGLINWPIGGGENCQTKEPVTFTITSPDGEYFDALSGGIVTGVYDLPALENCGILTKILSSKLAGEGNSIELTMTPILN